jgi:PAS domain S-box-containing protein
MPSLIVGVDPNGSVTQWNKRVEESTGISAIDARGKNISDMLPRMAFEKEKIIQSIRTRQVLQEQRRPFETHTGIHYEDMTIYPLIANGVEGAVIRIDDVTDKVRIEEMMVQSEKMLSVGGLAAGMAHEINNPLAGIIQTADVIKSRLTDHRMPANVRVANEIGVPMEQIQAFMEKRDILKMLKIINESGRRVVKIVDNMLSFARKTDATVSFHNPATLMNQILELASTDHNLKTVKIKKQYEENLPRLPCEGAKIQQVLFNILRNGAQAMQAESFIKAVEPCFILRLLVEKETNLLRIEIEDNGPGMDKKTLKRIFEPFFTTKPPGIGTGLGLSISYFIITENHGGKMSVESNPGSGANFIIQLPFH